MNTNIKTLFSCLIFIFGSQIGKAQTPKLIWEINKIDLGTILEEQGPVTAEFKFTHTQDSIFVIEKVYTDCGCTTVDFTQDSLKVGEKGSVIVSLDPSSAAGFFSRMIVVKGNLAGTSDTLFIEGTAIPYPQNPELEYPKKLQGVGFRLDKVNMGDVFTNEPKIKEIEFYNFSKKTLNRKQFQYKGPEHIQLSMEYDSVRSNERGILKLAYYGDKKNDLGFFEDQFQFSFRDGEEISLEIIANIFEYFPPFSREELGSVANLSISPVEIDLKEIPDNEIVNKTVSLTNKGKEILEIRKVQGNCNCLTLSLPKTQINPGETVELQITFDPKGRKGIDQRNIYIFSNDPLNPVQSLILKSRVK